MGQTVQREEVSIVEVGVAILTAHMGVRLSLESAAIQVQSSDHHDVHRLTQVELFRPVDHHSQLVGLSGFPPGRHVLAVLGGQYVQSVGQHPLHLLLPVEHGVVQGVSVATGEFLLGDTLHLVHHLAYFGVVLVLLFQQHQSLL